VSIFNGKNYVEQGVTTLIGRGTEFKGTIDTQGSVRIEGLMEGQINAQGDIYVGEQSQVKADMIGKKIVVAGEVTGTIEAINGLEITSTGKVYGDVIGSQLVIAEGAIYKGKVNMDLISSKSVYDEVNSQKKTEVNEDKIALSTSKS